MSLHAVTMVCRVENGLNDGIKVGALGKEVDAAGSLIGREVLEN